MTNSKAVLEPRQKGQRWHRQRSLILPKLENKDIYCLIANHDLARAFIETNIEFNFTIFKTFIHFQAYTTEALPAAIIVDEKYLIGQNKRKLADLTQTHNIPLICLLSTRDLKNKLRAVRAGSSLNCYKPLDITVLNEQLEQLCHTYSKEKYRILILDNSLFYCDYYAQILIEAGMLVKAVTEPEQFFLTVEEFNPDLILIDFYLAGCTGLELATILRQEERYHSLPIIYISNEDDYFKQFALMSRSGGDSVLTKPVLPRHLVAAVQARAKHASLLLSYITHDRLTGLLNHRYLLQQLGIECMRATRHHYNFCFVMIDIDYFKNINDCYGHPTGDVLLKKFANFLQSSIRKTDFVGRYGGDEFALIISHANLHNSFLICEKIRKKCEKMFFKVNNHNIKVTLSFGIAEFLKNDTEKNLVSAADQALYQAKDHGKNQVIIWNS